MSFSTMLSTMGEGMLRTCAIFFLTVLFSLPLLSFLGYFHNLFYIVLFEKVLMCWFVLYYLTA